MNTFNQQAILLCTGIIIGYALAEVAFNAHPFPLIPALALALAAIVTGIAIPLVAGFANTSILPQSPVGAVSPIQGFLFAAALVILVSAIFNFLFEVAERQIVRIRAEDTDSLSQ
jgi:hypothetical protein